MYVHVHAYETDIVSWQCLQANHKTFYPKLFCYFEIPIDNDVKLLSTCISLSRDIVVHH